MVELVIKLMTDEELQSMIKAIKKEIKIRARLKSAEELVEIVKITEGNED